MFSVFFPGDLLIGMLAMKYTKGNRIRGEGGLFVRCHEVTDKENSFPLDFVYCPHEVNFEHTIKRQPQSFK